jgi:lysophospholipase L1-like esterase
MAMPLRLRLLFLFLLVAAPLAPAQQLALHDGDRVAFYGDSITAQRYYTRFVEDIFLTRYPRLRIAFFNAGVPGDTVNGGYTGDAPTRLSRDLFPRQPTVVTIMLGMNDGYYMPFNQKYLDIYESGYRTLLNSIQTTLPAARITLISPTPYDELTHGTEFPHYGQVVARHAAFVQELATSSHLRFCDFFTPITDLTRAGMQENPALAALLVPDRIHPSEAAHWVMAAALARTWNVSPIVSSVHLDAGRPDLIAAVNAGVSGLTLSAGTLQWTQTDDALPLPLDLNNGMIQFVLGISNLAAMDQQMLGVDHLTAARYTLKIDSHAIATFKREELAAGVNLALYSTPMLSQARDVDGDELERTELDRANFILAIEDPKAPDAAGATKAIDEKNSILVEEQRKSAHPLPHVFELVPETR